MTLALRTKLILIAEKHSHRDDPCHDFQHVLRVLKNAEMIRRTEGGDEDIIIPAALFHDIINYPKNSVKASESSVESALWAQSLLQTLPEYPQEKVSTVCEAISECSFSKGLIPKSLESKILQDADGLEATGAIGIMRTFSYCGTANQPYYNVEDPFYKKRPLDNSSHSSFGLDLFYRRLLLHEERMHTKTARRIARQRTSFLRAFLDEVKIELSE